MRPKSWILDRVKVDERGCWLWQGTRDACGYGRVRIGRLNTGAHRVAYDAFVGPIGDAYVLHRCDVPQCVNPEHLFLGTQTQNVRDAIAKGRWPSKAGEGNGRCKLTDVEVAQIRAHRGWLTRKHLGSVFGVHKSHVDRIFAGTNRVDEARLRASRVTLLTERSFALGTGGKA